MGAPPLTVTLETSVTCPSCGHKIPGFLFTTVRVNRRSVRVTGKGRMLGAFEDCPGCREEIPRDRPLEREPYRLSEEDAEKVAEYRKAKWGIEGDGVSVEQVAG